MMHRDFLIEKEEDADKGEVQARECNAIPLFEDWDRLLNCDRIVRDHLKDKDLRHMRVFLAFLFCDEL